MLVFTKKEICAVIAIVCFIFCGILWVYDYPGTTTFACYKHKNICIQSSANIFHYKFEKTIEFNKILNTEIEEEAGTKRVGRYGTRRQYYYYNWVAYYNNNGTVEKFQIFRTSDYDFTPANKEYDSQYRYFEDVKNMFNDSFLKDETKSRFYAPIYESSDVRTSFWEIILMTTYILGYSLFAIILIIVICDPIAGIKRMLKSFKR